ncbi:uncharacterized protein LOC144100304 isoform X1 [Amblyomma americanum]
MNQVEAGCSESQWPLPRYTTARLTPEVLPSRGCHGTRRTLSRHLGNEPSGSRVFRGYSHSIDCRLSPRRCLPQPHGLQCQQCSLVLVTTLKGAQSTSGGAVDHFYLPSSSAARPDSMFCLEAKAGLHRHPSGTLQRQRTSSFPLVLRISGTGSLQKRRLLQTKSGWGV